MIRAAIVTRWVQTINAQGFVQNMPAILTDVVAQPGDQWGNITGQNGANIPPRPNLLVVGFYGAEATLAAIKAHAQYGNFAVLWEGDPALSPVVTEPQYDQLVAWLANKFNATQTQVRNILGATSGGRTRLQIANEIIAYLRTRPKA